jgi:hypothetical protein
MDIPSPEALKTHHDHLWGKLPEELRKRIVAAAVEVLKRTEVHEVMIAVRLDPLSWWVPYHLHWGMWFRNQMREAGLRDDIFPEGHWDDYYIRAVEEALKEF